MCGGDGGHFTFFGNGKKDERKDVHKSKVFAMWSLWVKYFVWII